MNRAKRRWLALPMAIIILFCLLFSGCGDIVINGKTLGAIEETLRTINVVYPNLDTDDTHKGYYVGRTVTYNLYDCKYHGPGPTMDEFRVNVLIDGKLRDYYYPHAYSTPIGYIYLGIYDRREGGNRICYLVESASADEIMNMQTGRYYYAHFDPIPFIIEFDCGGGSSVPEATVLYDGTVTSFGVPVPPSEKYEFDGWYSDSGLTDRVTDAEGNVLPSKQQFNAVNYQLDCLTYIDWRNIVEDGGEEYTSVLHARFTEKTYTVGLDYGYGREELNTEQTVVHGSVLDELPSPELDGYKVRGWAYDADGVHLYNGEEITGNTELHAVWRRYRYLDLWSNGEKVKNLLIYDGMVYYPVSSPEFALEREGYTLAGWYTSPYFEADTKITAVNFADSYSALYAKWEPVA